MADAAEPTFGSTPWQRARAYQPFYCEENVWRLLADGALPEPGAAVFVGNRDRTVAMWGQRASRSDPIVWDYHVVALLPHRRLIVDLDDRERAVRPLADWLRHAFRDHVEPAYRPRFRIVPKAEFLATFSSDRSHMRAADGTALQPPPPWPAPFVPARGSNLLRFVDFDDTIAGVVTEREGLLAYAPR